MIDYECRSPAEAKLEHCITVAPYPASFSVVNLVYMSDNSNPFIGIANPPAVVAIDTASVKEEFLETSMSAEKRTVLAFDAYGTLLSTESIAHKLASHFGQDKAKAIAASWRKYQLEYTWRLNSMKQYEDFSKVTYRSLQHALAESSESLNQGEIENLMEAYNGLSIFPDVAPCLEAIKAQPHLHPVVFSNGTHQMVSASVHNSPDLGPFSSVFRDIVVVEDVKRFKPDPEVYFHLARKVGLDPESDMGDLWLISGNPFDVVGARAVGMRACWVDRVGNGWQDELVEGHMGRPTAIVRSLKEVVNVVNFAGA